MSHAFCLVLRCSRFSPSYCDFFELSEVMGVPWGYPLNRPYLFGGFSMHHGRIFPESPIEAKGARASGAIHGRGRAVPMWPWAPGDVMGWHGMSCQGGSLPTWCWAPSLRSGRARCSKKSFRGFLKSLWHTLAITL